MFSLFVLLFAVLHAWLASIEMPLDSILLLLPALVCSKKFEESAKAPSVVEGELVSDYESCSEMEAKPVMVRPGSIASVSSKGSNPSRSSSRQRHGDEPEMPQSNADIDAVLDKELERTHSRGAATPSSRPESVNTEDKVLARISDFNGKLMPEDLSKLSRAGQEAAKVGAKSGAEAAAVAGACFLYDLVGLMEPLV